MQLKIVIVQSMTGECLLELGPAADGVQGDFVLQRLVFEVSEKRGGGSKFVRLLQVFRLVFFMCPISFYN